MTDLLVHPSAPGPDGTILSVSPESAEWEYVGFEVLALGAGTMAERDCGDRELCVVVISGTAKVDSEHGQWRDLGGRADPWSGPPDPPAETFLEETYYHRLRRSEGFGLQRVYTDDRRLDETLSFSDRDCVLVPHGYHTVSAPPGYDLYYLNVMAGPRRQWAVVNDPDHDWRLAPTH